MGEQILKKFGIAGGVLLGAMAAFQLVLAAGSPLGAYVYGGANEGVLPDGLRVSSLLAAVFLLFVALVLVAQVGVIRWSPIPTRSLKGAAWVVGGLMALNTLANLASVTFVERFIFGAITAYSAVAFFVAAKNGSGPRI
jgi:hypothetical protein